MYSGSEALAGERNSLYLRTYFAILFFVQRKAKYITYTPDAFGVSEVVWDSSALKGQPNDVPQKLNAKYTH